MRIDAFGKQCPMPMMMAKKEIDKGCRNLSIAVDNDTAVQNITRLGKQTGLSVVVREIEGGYLITLSDSEVPNRDDNASSVDSSLMEQVPSQVKCSDKLGCGYAVFIGKDHLGEGDQELGYNLMKMALYTLSESELAPASLLFMNSGVKLLCEDDKQIIAHVKAMAEKGSEVLVCGTCLDFYNVKDKLQAGSVSNMYDILERMHEAAKVISL